MKWLCQVLGVLLSVLSFGVYADDYTWLPVTGTESFQNSDNWNPAGVPGASDTAQFVTSGTYGVSFGADVENSSAVVGSAGGTDVSFNLNGYSLFLGALSFSDSATLYFGGGDVFVNTAVSVGANQKLALNSGSCEVNSLSIPSSGGSVEVNGGDFSVSNAVSLYPTLSDDPALKVTDGSFLHHGFDGRFVMYTYGGKGPVVDIEGGELEIGNIDVYDGEMNIYTNAAFLTRVVTFGRGSYRTGRLNIYGGTVSNVTANAIAIGMGTGRQHTTGMVHLVDGVLYNSSGANLGGSSGDARTTNSVGIINVEGGGVYLGTVYVEANTWTRGLYTQSAGTAWCKYFRMGAAGTGALGEINLSGGTLAINDAPSVGYASTCTGLIYQTGGNLIISNGINVANASGSTGLIEFSGGNTEIQGDINLGNAAGGYGLLEYNGTNAYISGNVRIGNVAGAYGKFIYNGSSLDVGGWLIGATSGATGELEVAGGKLVEPSYLNVAAVSGSIGRLRVTGGDVEVGNSLYVGASGGYGELTLESGSIRIAGAGTGLAIGNGSNATGTLHITGGSCVVTNYYALFASTSSGGYGEIVISGGTNDFASGRIGHSGGTGFLRIEGGTTYFTNAASSRLTIANMLGSTGRLEVAGGVLSVRTVGTWHETDPTKAEILFDGGVLQRGIPGDDLYFIGTGFDSVTLTDRGAVIDSNGTSLGIPQALSDEPGYAGRFTKIGAGSVTLSSMQNTFTGPLCVQEGELAVSGAVYLTGGVDIDEGAVLNLSGGIVRDAITAAGTTSRVDGVLCLAPGMTLTNGTGAAFCGSGVVTGDVVFASGSIWALDKNEYGGALTIDGSVRFVSGSSVELTGYSEADLAAGIPLVQAVYAGSILSSGVIPVTLDGASHPYWVASVSIDGKTLTAKVVPLGTLLMLN